MQPLVMFSFKLSTAQMAVFTMETVSVPSASVIPDGQAKIVPSFTATTYTTAPAMASAWALMSASAFQDIW